MVVSGHLQVAANLLEVETAVNEETKARADIQDQIATAERKGNLAGPVSIPIPDLGKCTLQDKIKGQAG